MTNSNIIEQLKESTRELHQTAENHPFQQSLVRGTVSRASYVAFLSQLWLIHDALESRLRHLEIAPQFRDVIRPYHFRASLIQSDLDALGANGDVPALLSTQDLVTEINDGTRTNAVSALGSHYVLEGSTNGSQFIARSIERGFALSPGLGTSYLNPHKELQQERWAAFKSAMSSIQFQVSDSAAIVSSAQSMFRGLTKVSQNLLESGNTLPHQQRMETSKARCPVAR